MSGADGGIGKVALGVKHHPTLTADPPTQDPVVLLLPCFGSAWTLQTAVCGEGLDATCQPAGLPAVHEQRKQLRGGRLTGERKVQTEPALVHG